ncbi:7292_t:CDS:2, partial [Entrophospora sp. SA101]
NNTTTPNIHSTSNIKSFTNNQFWSSITWTATRYTASESTSYLDELNVIDSRSKRHDGKRKALSLMVDSFKSPSGQPNLSVLSNNTTLTTKEKRKTISATSSGSSNAAKKVMDWFRRKSLAKQDIPITIDNDNVEQAAASTPDLTSNNNNGRSSKNNIFKKPKSNNNNPSVIVTQPNSIANSSSSSRQSTMTSINLNVDAKLRVHNGALDQLALTERPPYEVFIVVKQTLLSMGIEIRREGEFKVKCLRRKRKGGVPIDNNFYSNNDNNGNKGTSQVSESTESLDVNTEKKLIYGDPTVDSGEEVRFSVELCRIKNLPGLYIVDIKRLKGNRWSYKFLYHTLLDRLDLKGQSGYLTIGTSGVEYDYPDNDNNTINNLNDNDNFVMSEIENGMKFVDYPDEDFLFVDGTRLASATSCKSSETMATNTPPGTPSTTTRNSANAGSGLFTLFEKQIQQNDHLLKPSDQNDAQHLAQQPNNTITLVVPGEIESHKNSSYAPKQRDNSPAATKSSPSPQKKSSQSHKRALSTEIVYKLLGNSKSNNTASESTSYLDELN